MRKELMDYDTRVMILNALKRAEEAATLGRWDDVLESLGGAIDIVKKRRPPEWRPRHGGTPRPTTGDPFDRSPSPTEDPYGE